MFTKLRKHLTLIYTLITGSILTVLIAGALLYAVKQINEQQVREFQDTKSSVIYTLQVEKMITNTWLAQTEAKGNLIIHIEDSGHPFFFKGAWRPQTDRGILIERAKEAALAENIDTASFPVSFYQINSSVFTLEGNQGEKYYAAISIIPSERGWKSLTLLKELPEHNIAVIKTVVIYILFAFIGIIALGLASWLLVGKALRPVEDNHKKQIEFVAAASHELRSPLSVIRASASALLSDPSQWKRFLPGIEKECRRMARLIDDMLLLASSDAGRWSFIKEDIDMDTLLIDTFELYEPLCKKKEQALFLDLPDKPLPHCAGDKQRLQQAVAILLDNALSYTPCGGKIFIRAHEVHDKIQIEIADNGPGISQEEKQYIFDRFYRADKSRKEKDHFGLGLSIAKELVLLHHGNIAVSDTPGGGATFVIELQSNG